MHMTLMRPPATSFTVQDAITRLMARAARAFPIAGRDATTCDLRFHEEAMPSGAAAIDCQRDAERQLISQWSARTLMAAIH